MEDFVPFKLAKKLKEKGFTLPESNIIGKFDSDGVFHSQLYINFTETMDSEEIIAPTISQVLKWLFDEKQLFINVDCNICDHLGLYFKVYKKGEETWEECATGDDYFYHPTEAIFADIEYIIDNNLI